MALNLSGIWHFWNSAGFFDQLVQIFIKPEQKQEKAKSSRDELPTGGFTPKEEDTRMLHKQGCCLPCSPCISGT